MEGGRRALPHSRHAPSSVCSSSLLLCPESLLSWFLEISGIHPEPAARAAPLCFWEIGRESASLGSLAQQPTPTCCFLVFIETSLFQLPLPTMSQNQQSGQKTRGGTWVVCRVCCAVAQHDFPQCVLGLFLLDLLPLLTVKHLGSSFWQLLMGVRCLF